MTTEEVDPEVKQDALDIKHSATALDIVDNSSMQQGAEILREIKTVRKRLKDVFKPVVDAQKAALDVTRNEFKKYDVPLKMSEDKLKSGIGRFQVEQERERQVAEAKLQEAARKQAEEVKLQQASAAEAAGNKEAADIILEQEVVVPTVKVEATKAEGVSTREAWSAEVVDLMALAKAVVAGEVPVEYIQGNDKMLNAMARAQKSAFKVAGVKATMKTSVSARSY
jgi:hypothetical protein